MKTEVRKEHGDWILFVDDNPQFSFMYREEAEKVRNMVDALVEAHGNLDKTTSAGRVRRKIEQVLTDAGAEL